MPTPIVAYARRGVEVARRGGRGFVSFVAAVFLSPPAVLEVVQVVNDYYHGAVEDYVLPAIIVLMIASVLVPIVGLAVSWTKPSRNWAVAALVISLLGWGSVVWFAATFVAPGMRN